jgi:hypothetical protein
METIKKILVFIAGKKTYIIATTGVVLAIVGLADGTLTTPQFIEAILAALGLSALRAGVTKSGPQ